MQTSRRTLMICRNVCILYDVYSLRNAVLTNIRKQIITINIIQSKLFQSNFNRSSICSCLHFELDTVLIISMVWLGCRCA